MTTPPVRVLDEPDEDHSHHGRPPVPTLIAVLTVETDPSPDHPDSSNLRGTAGSPVTADRWHLYPATDNAVLPDVPSAPWHDRGATSAAREDGAR